MLYLFKIGNKVPGDPRYWLDGQLVNVKPSGSPIGKIERKCFFIIEDGRDYWKLRGDTDWKSTKPSVLEFKKMLYVPDYLGRYPWDAHYIEEEGKRKRDYFCDFKHLLNEKIITQSIYENIYGHDLKTDILYLDRDPSTYLFHEFEKTRLAENIEDLNQIAQDGLGSGTGGGFTIGAAGDFTDVADFEADIAAQLTGDLHGLHLSEETVIAGFITFDTDTNSHTLYLIAESGCEHDGSAYGNGARINFATNNRIIFDETAPGDLSQVEISKLSLDISGAANRGIYLIDAGDSGLVNINRMVIKGDSASHSGIYQDPYISNLEITNNIVYGCSNVNAYGIFIYNYSALQSGLIYNNTAIGNYYNFYQGRNTSPGNMVFKNNLTQNPGSADYTDAGNGFGTTGHNISEDATSPDVAYRSKDLHTNTIFKGYATDDYRLDPAGDATNLQIVDDGEDLSGTFTDDIEGQTRSTWYIGASEIVAAGGVTVPVLEHTRRQQIRRRR